MLNCGGEHVEVILWLKAKITRNIALKLHWVILHISGSQPFLLKYHLESQWGVHIPPEIIVGIEYLEIGVYLSFCMCCTAVWYYSGTNK